MSERDYSKYQKEYSEKGLSDKIKKVAKKAGAKVIYIVLLLHKVLVSGDVSMADKAKIIGALGYFILPFDLIPDVVFGLGFTDDLAALLWALDAIRSNITPQMKAEAKAQIREWFGSFDEKELDSII